MKKYKLGVVEANTIKELAKNTIGHIGLGLADDNYIGKEVAFDLSKMDSYGTKHTEIKKRFIISKQKMWGYDVNGKYTIVEGYRVSDGTESDFGSCHQLNELIILS